ncbi:MAG: DedA family protein [Actinobacteria bacterium]|nr:DedA family protein [Actinomycetota bacterium]
MNILKNIYHFLTNIRPGSIYVGLGFGMFLESLGIPFAFAPFLIISSEKVGENIFTYIFSVLAGSIGGTLGSSISYGIGRGIITPFRKRLKKNNFNNFKKSNKPNKINRLIKKYGEFSVFLAQLIGQTRTFISYPAGALKFNFKKFVLYTFLESAIWCALTLGLITFINELWHKYKPLVEIHSGLIIIILFVIMVFISQIWIYIISRRTKKDIN